MKKKLIQVKFSSGFALQILIRIRFQVHKCLFTDMCAMIIIHSHGSQNISLLSSTINSSLSMQATYTHNLQRIRIANIENWWRDERRNSECIILLYTAIRYIEKKTAILENQKLRNFKKRGKKENELTWAENTKKQSSLFFLCPVQSPA